jgi:hypothetical protein
MTTFILLAVESTSSDDLGNALKIVQICFYSVAAIVAVITCITAGLTYRAAVRGWLTPTNTEYQKRVMDRLATLSEDLYSEFDPDSENYWAGNRIVHTEIEEINQTFERHKETLLAERKWLFGSPVTQDVQRLRRLLEPVRSDPFIPENIREEVVDLLENRVHVLQGIYLREFEKYTDNLAKGKQLPIADIDDANKIHNRIVEQMNKQGCGIGDIENSVHEIRAMIQDYFDSFNPHGAGKGKRKRFAKQDD